MSDDVKPDPMAPSDTGTKEALAQDAQKKGRDAGPMPTPEEEAAAERGAAQAPDISEEYKEQVERGADVEGEGQI